MELKKYKLGECLELQRGYDLTSSQMQGGEVEVVGSNGIIGYHNSERGNSPCITVGRSGSVGKVHYYEQPTWAHNTALFIKDFKGNNPKYLYYLLKNLHLDNIFEKGSSVIPSLDRKLVHSLVVPFHKDINDQRKVVDVLSAIDRKIELNKQINDNLEAMAKQLYDYWFVQFDFPNEEGKPYKSSGGAMVWNEKLKHQIPEGWEVKQLRDIIETNRGISYNTSSISGGGVPMINLASFNVDGSYKDAGLKSYNGNYTQEKILKPFDLVLCNTQQTAIEFSKDIIGKAFLIPDIFDGDIVSSHHINTIKTEEVLKPYLAYLSNTYHFHKYATGCCSGTNILGLDYNSFSQYKLEIPPKYLLKEFHDFIIDIVKRKSLIIKENKLLTKQRNELLPLLMNGQATVNYHLSVVNVVARLPFYRRLPIFMYCFILLLLSRLSWYNKNVRLQEMGDVVKGVIKEVA